MIYNFKILETPQHAATCIGELLIEQSIVTFGMLMRAANDFLCQIKKFL